MLHNTNNHIINITEFYFLQLEEDEGDNEVKLKFSSGGKFKLCYRRQRARHLLLLLHHFHCYKTHGPHNLMQ